MFWIDAVVSFCTVSLQQIDLINLKNNRTMEVVEKKEMVHKDVYESGEKEYASKGVAGTGLGLIY